MAEGIGQAAAANRLKLLRGVSVNSPYSAGGGAGTYVGLLTALPPATGDTSSIEVSTSGTGYARYGITAASAPTFWSVPQNREIHNLQTVLFGPVTQEIPTIVGFALYGTAAATEAIAFGHLDSGHTATVDNYIKFAPGQLKIRISRDATRKSELLANKQLLLFLNQTYSLPQNSVWIGLGTKLPTASGDIGELTSTNAPGYARVEYASNTTTWLDPAAGRTTSNLEEMEFADATENWHLIKSFGIFVNSDDPSTDPTPWYMGALDSDVLIRKYDNLIIPQNALVIQE